MIGILIALTPLLQYGWTESAYRSTNKEWVFKEKEDELSFKAFYYPKPKIFQRIEVLTCYSASPDLGSELVFSEGEKNILKRFDNEVSDLLPVHVTLASVGWRIFDF